MSQTMTMEKGKAVVWTEKVFIADKYPLQDFGENYTLFYKNLKDKDSFTQCLAKIPPENKIELVSVWLGIPVDEIVLKSKQSHFKAKHKNKKP